MAAAKGPRLLLLRPAAAACGFNLPSSIHAAARRLHQEGGTNKGPSAAEVGNPISWIEDLVMRVLIKGKNV